MGREALARKPVKMCIYLRAEQYDYLTEKAEEAGVSRGKYIESKVFPAELQLLSIDKKNRNK